MAITNYSDVEVKGNISSTKQGRLIGVLSSVPSSATGYNAGDTVLVNSTFYTLTNGSWVQTTLISRPITSTAVSLQVKGPFSSSSKPSGRMAA